MGKPNQDIPLAPLQPIPAVEEPFSRIIIDCVGPLTRTKSRNQYMLTMMCTAMRFPEAILLRAISSRKLVGAMINFFPNVGLSKSIQTGQGSNFRHMDRQLGIQHVKSRAYQLQSQRVLERFHATLKNMLRAYCLEHSAE